MFCYVNSRFVRPLSGQIPPRGDNFHSRSSFSFCFVQLVAFFPLDAERAAPSLARIGLYQLVPLGREISLQMGQSLFDLNQLRWGALRACSSQHEWGQTFQSLPNRIAGHLTESAFELPHEIPLVVECFVQRLIGDLRFVRCAAAAGATAAVSAAAGGLRRGRRAALGRYL